MNQQTALYRHFDAAGRLLYVGISLSAVARASQHRDQPWFMEMATMTTEWLSSREEAHAAERAAIRDEKPVHNKQRYGGTVEAPEPVVPAPEPELPLTFLSPLSTSERNALLTKLEIVPATGEVSFFDACRVLGVGKRRMLRLMILPDGVTCPLTTDELRELAHRLIEGTAVQDAPRDEASNFSHTPPWAARFFGSGSELHERAIAVAAGRYQEAAWMYPAPGIATPARAGEVRP